jgi:hypothetical protein
VIVPDFGGFMAHHANARYDQADGMFLPPLRTLGFNPQLRINDHLLVQSYIEAYDISYPEALRRIENEVEELKQHLENEGEYDLTDLGLLRLNEEGNYEFEPCEAGILSPTLYGLSSFSMLPVANLSNQQEESDTGSSTRMGKESRDSDKEQDAIVIRMSWIRNVVAIAASILLFFFISTPIDNSELGGEVQQSSMLPIISKAEVKNKQKDVPQFVSKQETSNTTQEGKGTDTTLSKTERVSSTTGYTIVLASHTSLSHAEDFIGTLNTNGITGARVLNIKKSSKVRVVIGSFGSEAEAQSQLREYRTIDKRFKEAWVLHVND